MMERRQEMKQQKQNMQDDIKAQDAQLTEQLANMNHAPEDQKTGLMAAALTHIAEQRIAEPRVLLVALRRVAEARGLAKVAKTAGIERESLYRALSPRGNPRFSTLVAVAKAMGLKLTFESGR